MPETVCIPTSADRDRNLAKLHHGDDYPCVVCGRPVRKVRYTVHEVLGGGVACLPEDDHHFETVEAAGDLGGQPIGTDCLRKYPELKPYARRIE